MSGLAMLAASSEPPPGTGVNRQRLYSLRSNVEKGSMFLNGAVAEQSGKQRQRVIGQCAVDERLLPLQRFQSTATRESVVFERGVDQLRKQFARRSQALGGTAVPPVPRLAEHDLPATGMVPQVEPVADGTSGARHAIVDGPPGCSSIDAADHDIDLVNRRALTEVLRHSVPVE